MDKEYLEELREMFDEAVSGLELSDIEKSVLSQLPGQPSGLEEYELETIADIITKAKETPLPPRMFEEFEVKSSFYIGTKEVVFCETKTPKAEHHNCTYYVASCGFDNPLGIAWPEKSSGYTSFIEAVSAFNEHVQNQLDVVKAEREQRGDNPPLTDDACIQGSEDKDYTNQVVVYNPDALRPENKYADNQIFLARNGFGCKPGASGRAVYSTNLYTGEETRLNRPNILGIIKPEAMPEWAKEKLAVLGVRPLAATEEKSVLAQLNKSKEISAATPKTPAPGKTNDKEL